MKSIAHSFSVVLLFLAPATTSAQSVDEIVNDYYKVVSGGGIDDCKKIKT